MEIPADAGANNGLSLQGSSLTNRGNIVSRGQQNSTIVMNDTIDNSGAIEGRSGLQLNARQINNRQSASIHAQKDISLTSQNLVNNGQIGSDTGSIQATINGYISNNNGTMGGK